LLGGRGTRYNLMKWHISSWLFTKLDDFPPFVTYIQITQPKLQRRPNPTELRSMISSIQILCRFQKSKQKVPPSSPLSTQKSSITPHPWVLRGDGGGTLAYIFGIYMKFGSIDLNVTRFGWCCNIGWGTSIHCLVIFR
jgi:hypothetical protein